MNGPLIFRWRPACSLSAELRFVADSPGMLLVGGLEALQAFVVRAGHQRNGLAIETLLATGEGDGNSWEEWRVLAHRLPDARAAIVALNVGAAAWWERANAKKGVA